MLARSFARCGCRSHRAAEPGDAVLADFVGWERSVLALYDGDGRLRYESILPFRCTSLRPDVRDAEGDVLVVGCEGRVLLFGRDLPLHRTALAIRSAFLGPRNPAVAEEERSLAWAYYQAERITEAETHAERAIAIVEDRYGSDAPENAGNWETLALVREAQGRSEEAERLLQKALVASLPPDSPNHEHLWAVHFGLGALYEASQRVELARLQYEAALATLPDGDASTSLLRARIAHALARLLHSVGRHEQARRAVELAIEHGTRAVGADHASVESHRTLEREIDAALATPAGGAADLVDPR